MPPREPDLSENVINGDKKAEELDLYDSRAAGKPCITILLMVPSGQNV